MKLCSESTFSNKQGTANKCIFQTKLIWTYLRTTLVCLGLLLGLRTTRRTTFLILWICLLKVRGTLLCLTIFLITRLQTLRTRRGNFRTRRFNFLMTLLGTFLPRYRFTIRRTLTTRLQENETKNVKIIAKSCIII